jgi:integrase/recombinase XerD
MSAGRAGRVRVSGPLALFASGFRDDLSRLGYKSGLGPLTLMAHLSRWMAAEGLGVEDLSRERVEMFLVTFGQPGRRVSWSMGAALPVLDYLVRVGAVPVWGPRSAITAAGMVIEDFKGYLQDERNLSASTVRDYADVARSFLSYVSPSDNSVDLGALTAGVVTEFVMAEARRGKVASAKAMTTRLRCFLRFLHVKGLTPISLVGAVPSVAGWRGASLPKALDARQVAGLLESCDRRTSVGRRDFAILVVLSRLGLRAGEVARLRLGDIDWRLGEVAVHGKGNRHDRLPLPVDVGEAIVGWLQRGRPRCEATEVFVRVRAPQRGLSSEGVSAVVWHACDRAGMPRMGAHRLRHTAATQLLQAGGTLAEVGQVLRHRSSGEITSIYAKVDRRSLSALVRPWPGASR